MQDGFGKRARSGRYRVGAIMISTSDANILYSRFARKFGKVSRAHRRFRSLPILPRDYLLKRYKGQGYYQSRSPQSTKRVRPESAGIVSTASLPSTLVANSPAPLVLDHAPALIDASEKTMAPAPLSPAIPTLTFLPLDMSLSGTHSHSTLKF
jgi:hypothetical protein